MRNAIIYIFLFAFAVFTQFAVAFEQAESEWTRISMPSTQQMSQMDAGYPMGCMITTMLYALKFGPSDWKTAYHAIPGTNDVAKIREIARIFGLLKSHDVPSSPAFSEIYGTNPNDLSWMFRTLMPDSSPLKDLTLAKPHSPSLAMDNDLIRQLRANVKESLVQGRPILTQLFYKQPDRTHAVLITGIEETEADLNLSITVLDPMTGEESVALLSPGIIILGGREFAGLTFLNEKVASRNGFLFAIWH